MLEMFKGKERPKPADAELVRSPNDRHGRDGLSADDELHRRGVTSSRSH